MADNNWIMTYSGRQFYPLSPRIEDISILDIAHALSNICRFTGHVREFYSVGEHSLRAAQQAPQYLKLAVLLHDASEAYLNDLSRPVKHSAALVGYRAAEKHLQDMIGLKFGVEFTDPLIHEIDNRMLMTERRDLMPASARSWNIEQWPYADIIHPAPNESVECHFLEMYENLMVVSI